MIWLYTSLIKFDGKKDKDFSWIVFNNLWFWIDFFSLILIWKRECFYGNNYKEMKNI